MKFGFVLPHGDARNGADLAQAAEASGWDGFFRLGAGLGC